jgi:glutamate racemase
VPLIENGEHLKPGADYFVDKYLRELLSKDPLIDTLILGCTHYPLLLPKIHKYMPRGIRIIAQGEYVANSLQDYLERHPEIEQRCTRSGKVRYMTTENPEKFKEQAQLFLHEPVEAEKITLG